MVAAAPVNELKAFHRALRHASSVKVAAPAALRLEIPRIVSLRAGYDCLHVDGAKPVFQAFVWVFNRAPGTWLDFGSMY
jgi:hypothetical protein